MAHAWMLDHHVLVAADRKHVKSLYWRAVCRKEQKKLPGAISGGCVSGLLFDGSSLLQCRRPGESAQTAADQQGRSVCASYSAVILASCGLIVSSGVHSALRDELLAIQQRLALAQRKRDEEERVLKEASFANRLLAAVVARSCIACTQKLESRGEAAETLATSKVCGFCCALPGSTLHSICSLLRCAAYK
jgi:hypothetical protein